jgi:acetyltransferase
MSGPPLSSLFEPRAVAVIGVSARSDDVGHRLLSNIRESGYGGPLYAVSAERSDVAAVETYPSVSALPQRVDLAVIAVPAENVPDVTQQCGEHGVRFALVLSGGFADTDAQGSYLLRETLASARRSGVRVVGPSCLGIMREAVGLNASFSRGIGRAGGLALVSHSGALCSAVTDWAQERHIGFSTVASLGVAADVSYGEVLDYLAVDANTRAILLYLEGVDHARSFMSGLRAAARIKPVIVVKAGRTERTEPPATSHTGTIVGDDAVFDAALRRAGAVRVSTLSELFSVAELLSHAPRPTGEQLAIITNAGGLGVLAVDRAFALGVSLAPLSAATRKELGTLLPPSATAENPLVIREDATPERYARAVASCLADPTVHGILVLLSPLLLSRPYEVAEALLALERRGKPLLACFMGGAQVQRARQRLAEAQVACFDSPEGAVEAFRHLVQHRRNQTLLVQAPEAAREGAASGSQGARLIIEAALASGRRKLSQLESKAVLRAFGVPIGPALRARTADEALVAAESLGFPVAMKIDSPDIAHKTEVRGVRLDIDSASAVRTVYGELTRQVAELRPDARIDGVLIEPMIERGDGREVIVGVSRDRALGPAIAVGAGGTLVELLGAPAIGLPPLNETLARDMLAQPTLARWLGAHRDQPAVDAGALVRVLTSVSQLVCELAEVQELDINPLLVTRHGALALDARIVVSPVSASSRPYAHLAIAPYPRHLVRTVQLADGTPLTVRPILPEDAELEQDFVRDLSLESRHLRFMHALSQLTPDLLLRFTQLDYDRELALVAIFDDGARTVEVGVARYVGDPDRTGCEFAIVVADAWQKRGVAAQLMGALIAAARSQRYSQMHGDVLAENGKMLRWMSRLGFTIAVHPEDATLRIVTLDLL